MDIFNPTVSRQAAYLSPFVMPNNKNLLIDLILKSADIEELCANPEFLRITAKHRVLWGTKEAPVDIYAELKQIERRYNPPNTRAKELIARLANNK